MIVSYKDYIVEREQRNASLFTNEEKILIEDLLQEYIDKYNMIEMPKDEENNYFFDEDIQSIQYLVQRLRNISIDIECVQSISLDEAFSDINTKLSQRLQKYGYSTFHCTIRNNVYINGCSINMITMTITKN